MILLYVLAFLLLIFFLFFNICQAYCLLELSVQFVVPFLNILYSNYSFLFNFFFKDSFFLGVSLSENHRSAKYIHCFKNFILPSYLELDNHTQEPLCLIGGKLQKKKRYPTCISVVELCALTWCCVYPNHRATCFQLAKFCLLDSHGPYLKFSLTLILY